MGIFSIFTKKDKKKLEGKSTSFLSVGGGLSFFARNQKTINATYRNCVDCFGRHISKIKPTILLNGEESERRAQLNYLIGLRPNPIQTASEFYYVLGTEYCNGIARAHIERPYGSSTVTALIPVDSSNLQLWKDGSEIIVKATGVDGNSFTDYLDNFLVVIRKSNTENPMLQVDNSLDQILKAVNASNESFAKAAIKSHAIKYIATSSNPTAPAMVSKDIEQQLESSDSGIIQLPALVGLQAVKQSDAVYARSPELDDFLAEIYSYFGFSKGFVMGSFTEDQFQSVYESAIEPFVNALSQEMTYKLLSRKEIGFGNRVEIVTNPLQTATLNTRIKLASTMMTCATYRPNDIRSLLYQEPIEGGDDPVHNLTFTDAGKKKGNESEEGTDTQQSDAVEENNQGGQEDVSEQ